MYNVVYIPMVLTVCVYVSFILSPTHTIYYTTLLTVCTTEIGRLALKYDQLEAMDCLVATLSVDPVKSHTEWLRDVVAHCENKIEVCKIGLCECCVIVRVCVVT